MNWANMLVGPVVLNGWDWSSHGCWQRSDWGEVARMTVNRPAGRSGTCNTGKLNVRGSRVGYGTDAGRRQSRDW